MTFGLPLHVDPFDALTQEIDRTNGHIYWLSLIISTFDPEDLVWGDTMVEEGSGTGTLEGDTWKNRSEAGINVWLTLYQSERKHLVEVCKAAIQCGLAERAVQLQEAQGQLVSDFMRRVFDDPELGLDDATKRRLRETAIRHLRTVA